MPTMPRHQRRLSDPTPEVDFTDSFPSSPSSPSSPCLPSKPLSPTFNVFKACFSGRQQKLISLMATANRPCENTTTSSFRAGRDERDKCATGRQKRQELEQEVASLQKVLKDEEKVHEILERALLPSAARTTLNIPSFLPKKTKELLAEVVMVEEEIARLESEISKIQQDSSRTQKVREEESHKFDPYVTKKGSNAPPSAESLALTLPPKSKGTNEKLALETGPMFFINQAIKGDYILRGFNSKGKNETSAETVSKKETQRKTGAKQSSLRPPRNSSPRQSDANTEMLLKLLREPSAIPNPPEKDGHNWQPNKLSEKLMKCLICIFLRLIRTSRTLDQERSGNLSRSPTSLLRSSRSFQLQSGLNLKTSVSFQKETGQLDPCGVFEVEDSLTRDIGPYKNLIRCTSSSLDLKNISSSLQLLGKLRNLMNNLRKVDLRFLTHHQKLAFWINIYNTCIMHGFLEHGLPTSPEKIITLKNKAVLNVGGNKLNALAIEHFILKQPSRRKEAYVNSDKDEPEDVVRNIYGLEHPEPNIAFALCSGTRSSPSVKIYTADGVSSELEKSKLEFLQASLVVTSSKRLMVPKLLESNLHEFASDLGSLVEWICNQLPTSGSLKKSMAECLKGLRGNGEISEVVHVLPYNFEFQFLLPLS